MNQQNDPPILISDEWQHQNEQGPASASETGLADSPDDQGDREMVDDSEESAAASAEPTIPPSTLPAPRGENVALPTPSAQVSWYDLAAMQAELTALRAETIHMNEILDRLHAENERLRRGEVEQLLQPVFRDLLKLSDDWTAMAASWESKDAATPADVANKCRNVAEDAELILERYGVDSFAPDIGATVERRQHRVVGKIPAESSEIDNTVAEVRRPGYVYGEKVIRFAEVVAASYEG